MVLCGWTMIKLDCVWSVVWFDSRNATFIAIRDEAPKTWRHIHESTTHFVQDSTGGLVLDEILF